MQVSLSHQTAEAPPQFSRALENLSHQPLLDDLERFATYGETLQSAHHDYERLDLFSDDALLELLSNHPRRRIQCFTMGTDPEKPEEWKAVCIRGSNAETLLEAVRYGRIWLNITSPERYDNRYEALIRDMYANVADMCPTIAEPRMHYNTLVLAAPGTQFYYTVHPENNMVWNMRGHQTISSLPAMDFRFLSQELLEEIFAHEASGAIPYRNAFEQHAEHVEVGPGECAWWPQSAPTRMQYHDFCVSLFTSFYCPMRNRRDLVQLANRYILRPLGVDERNIQESGIGSELKQLLFRLMRKCRAPRKAYDFTDSYITNLRLDSSADNYVGRLDTYVAPEFSKFASQSGAAIGYGSAGGESDNYPLGAPVTQMGEDQARSLTTGSTSSLGETPNRKAS